MSERNDPLVNDEARLARVGFRGNLQTPGGNVNLFTDLCISNDTLQADLAKLSGVVPSLIVTGLKVEKSASIVILEDDAKSLRFNERTNKLVLTGNTQDFIDGQAVLWTSYWLMEAQRQEKSLFTLHSSALKINEKGILLLGHSGAGKTTVMLDLCRKYGGCVISNDLTIIGHDTVSGDMKLIDGTKDLRLRFSSVEGSFPDLVSLFQGTSGSTWEDKIVITPEHLGLRSCDRPNTLDAIFEIYLDSKEKDPLVVERDEGTPFLYRLYEDMSRIVRGSAISVFGSDRQFLGYMPSLDSESKHNNRVNCINQMVNTMGITSISGGNLDDVTGKIYDLVKVS